MKKTNLDLITLNAKTHKKTNYMICQFCDYEFLDGLGKYGCPNCHGEELDEDIDIEDQISDEDQNDL